MLGLRHSKETKRKIFLWNKGKKMSPESCRKMSASGKLKIFTLEHRQKMSEARQARVGDKAPDWKGGIIIDRKGYLLKHSPSHPYARTNGYIPFHRLVLEKKLGRYLFPDELAHHIDFDKTNNDPDNLTPMKSGEHTQYHFQIKYLFEHLVGA